MGQTTQDLSKYLGSGSYWINHCKKWGGYTRSNIQVMWSQWFNTEHAAKQWLEQFEQDEPDYYLKENKIWANQCKENTLDNPFYDGTIQTRRVKEGTHHLLSGEIQSKQQKKMLAEGTHSFIKKNENGLTSNEQRLKDGTHAFCDYDKMVAAQQKRIENGNHHFTDSEWQKQNQLDRVARGEHPFSKKKGKVACYDKNGNYVDIDRDLYYNQKDKLEERDYVHINSKEGKRRKHAAENRS